MSTIRSLTDNRPVLQKGATLALLGLAVLTIVWAARNTAPAQPSTGAQPSNASAQRAVAAYAARLEALAETYAPVSAYGARWQGLSDAYVSRQRPVEAYSARSAGVAETPSRSAVAYAGRWTGLAETYAPVQAYGARWAGVAEAHRQRATDAYAARWQGLAQAYLNK